MFFSCLLPTFFMAFANVIQAMGSNLCIGEPKNVYGMHDPGSQNGAVTMQRNTEDLLISAIGPFAAILLGMVLFPFRSYTSAANFAYLFIILTILIAEYGGRSAAFATALCSSLSLDFFLTQPYLQLTIKSMHDVVAFAGLALCGLLVATLAAQRGEKTSDLISARKQLDLFHSTVMNLADSTQIESHLRRLLDSVSSFAPLAGAAVRDQNNRVLAALGEGTDAAPIPAKTTSPFALYPDASDPAYLGYAPFPRDGVRIPLLADNRQNGWLDLWGNGAPANAEMRRSIADFAFLLGRMLEIRSVKADSRLQSALGSVTE